MNDFRLDFVRQRAEFAHVGEHDADFFAFAGQREAFGIVENLIEHLLGNVGFKGRPQIFALALFRRVPIENNQRIRRQQRGQRRMEDGENRAGGLKRLIRQREVRDNNQHDDEREAHRRELGKEDGNEDEQRCRDGEIDGPADFAQKIPRQNRVENRRMNVGEKIAGLQGNRADVARAGRKIPNQANSALHVLLPVGEFFWIIFSLQHI